MGANVCKALHIPLSESYQRRHDLKGSRFENEFRSNIHNGNRIKQRVQVQPITERMVEVNSSFLNHTESKITPMSNLDETKGFIERLDCSYCKQNSDNNFWNKNPKDQILDHHYKTPTPVDNQDIIERPAAPIITPPSMSPLPQSPKPELDNNNNNNSVKIITAKLKSRSLSSSSSSSSSASSASSNSIEMEDEFPVITVEKVSPIQENREEPRSISPIIYRSVSTIPVCSEDDDNDNDDGSENNSEDEDDDFKAVHNEKLMTDLSSETPRRRDSLPHFDSKFNLLVRSSNKSEDEGEEEEEDEEDEEDEEEDENRCAFCNYVNDSDQINGYWCDLDKDVTMLMDMADKLSGMIVQKEKEKGKLIKILESTTKKKKSKTATTDPNNNHEMATIFKREDIVEEKKVSLSHLKKFNSVDLKEKVQLLRRRRRIGISVMKTSAGKCLMDFSDGQNTYQVQIYKPQSPRTNSDNGGGSNINSRKTKVSTLTSGDIPSRSFSATSGGGSAISTAAASGAGVGHFEPIVDTLEVCDKAAARLRELAKHLEHGEVPNEVLQKTLQYAAYVLDTVTMDETRRSRLRQQQSQTNKPQSIPYSVLPQEQCCRRNNSAASGGRIVSQTGATIVRSQTPSPSPPPMRFLRSQSTSSSSPPQPLSSISSSSIMAIVPPLSSNQSSSSDTPSPPPLLAKEISSKKSSLPSSPRTIKNNNNISNISNDKKPKLIKLTPQSSTTSTDQVKQVILDQVDPQKQSSIRNDDVDDDNENNDNDNVGTTSRTNSATNNKMDKNSDPIQRRLLDEEDELAEVKPDAVPSEVREWLTSTFTKNQVSARNRSDDKPKFRSVANAIRAGIMVDRIYRRLFNATTIQIAPEVSNFLKGADEWSFDVFALNQLAPNKVLRNLATDLLNRYGLIHKFKIPTNNLEGFLSTVELGYQKYQNPYHNNLHAADVTQTVHYLLWVTGLAQWLTDLEIFATLIAAIIHDYQHTGTTNNFHIMSGSEISLMYNDRSVLENYHISEAFKVMRKDEANILINLSREEYREFRTLIIEMVIATDMSTHFQQIKTLKTILSHQEFVLDKQKGLSYILHSADISHPSKVFSLHQRWTLLLMEEFFRQGDMERELGLPYSPLCDRNSTLIPQSQIGFIEFIVYPTMELCGDLIERVYEHLNSSTTIAPTAKTTNKSKQDNNNGGDGDNDDAGVSKETNGTTKGANSNGPPLKKSSTVHNDEEGDICTNMEEKTRTPVLKRMNTSSSTPSSTTVITTIAPVFNMTISNKKLYRPWLTHLDQNKALWQQKATIEEAKRQAEANKLLELEQQKVEAEDDNNRDNGQQQEE